MTQTYQHNGKTYKITECAADFGIYRRVAVLCKNGQFRAVAPNSKVREEVIALADRLAEFVPVADPNAWKKADDTLVAAHRARTC
jgi:hypothetical protein